MITTNDDEDNTAPSCPPRLSTVKKRRRFTLQEKMGLVRSIRRRIEANEVSVRIACNEANIYHKQFLSWTKEFDAMQQAMNVKTKRLCLGRLSILKSIEYAEWA